MKRPTNRTLCLLLITALMAANGLSSASVKVDEERVPLTIFGGHDTDPRDHGRQIVLVAGALGVPPETFRRAFSGVHPAEGRPPTEEEARRNKAALLSVLAPFGITNDQLDRVSDTYRYRPGTGNIWRHQNAEGYAVVRDGKVSAIHLTRAGAGYSSAPIVQVPGYPTTFIKVTLKFGTNINTNGMIAAVEVPNR